MVNFKVSDILRIIEDEELEWQQCCDKLCKNSFLTDDEKDNLRCQCSIRVDALDQLKFKFL